MCRSIGNNKLLIISRYQFGYHTDVYNWCKYLKDQYQITVITPISRAEIRENGVNAIYSFTTRVKVLDYLIFVITCIKGIINFDGIIVVDYYKGASILKRLFPQKKMILDIRTLSVNTDKQKREEENIRLLQCARRYDHVTIISDGIRKKLGIDDKDSSVLPLGADGFNTSEKSYSVIRLLYVGTFYNRDLHKTIIGLKLFKEKYPSADITYEVVGSGWKNEEQELKELVAELALEEYVHFRGYISQDKLNPYFEKCNIGVSFVPLVDYYEYQPVTKSYEYVLSGLYTIATNTYANQQVINETNGILIQDTPESFAGALENIYLKRGSLNSELVKSSLQGCTWKQIVTDQFLPVLQYFENKYIR